MPPLPIAPLAVSQAGRAAHDLGLAGLLGGNLFGRLALHPSMTEISDPAERGRVVNAAWRRYGTVNSASLLAVAAGWYMGRPEEIHAKRLSGPEVRLARAKDALVAVVAITGLATAAQGVRFARMEPGGAVPLTDGSTTAPEATDAESRAKRRLDALGRASLVAEVALVGVNAALAQRNFRRPPLRRVLSRRL
ncbi:MAG TPA: hypothetical protein VF533_10765 [Solirubrobacteraceae bacterium]|jgi:hypothetical protein